MFINTIAPYGHASADLWNKLPPTLHRPIPYQSGASPSPRSPLSCSDPEPVVDISRGVSTPILKRSFSYLLSRVPNRQIDTV